MGSFIRNGINYSGGGSVVTDATLTKSGQAADAKAVGDAIARLEAMFNSINMQYLNTGEDMVQLKDSEGNWHDWAGGGLQILDVNTIALEDWDSYYDATHVTPTLSLNPFTISAINANATYELGVKYTSKNSYDLSGYKYLRIAGSAVRQGSSAGFLGTNPTSYIAILSEETGTLTKLKDFDVKVTGSTNYSFDENIALGQLSGRYKIVVVGSAATGKTGVLTLNSFKFSANEIL